MDFLALLVISVNLLLALVFLQAGVGFGNGNGFTFNGFRSAKLDLDGIAEFIPNGLLRLTNESRGMTAHAFYPHPIPFKNSTNGSSFSFSTTFVFAIVPSLKSLAIAGPGLAFVAAPQKDFSGATGRDYMGLFNRSNNGNDTNHVFAVELDTIQTAEFRDDVDNHVGIDINGLVSVLSAPAGYYPDDSAGKFTNLSLISGRAMRVWVDYDGIEKRINVTLAPLKAARPITPLLSLSRDLSPIVKDTMYVGFSAGTGRFLTSHYILGWSFQMNGRAEELSLSKLPNLPRVGKKPISKMLTIGVPILCIFSVSMLILGLVYHIRRQRKFAELLEDWELNDGTHRFKYKDLYIATRGFGDRELLGTGGFGMVYRGTLHTSKAEIAVKRISHSSRQGVREFVAEIITIGRLRHRNLVKLLGYCRRKGELLLVYDYMPNGSLEKYLFDHPRVTLDWAQRLKVIKGVASGLLYLHEGWEQVVIHRDLKASNVLLDTELNGRLGDFGLAKLYDHGSSPQTTRVVGTLGYLAPEHYKTGKATKATDVFAFGAFLLEVATGRRPIEVRGSENLNLVDRVFYRWTKGDIVEARDPNLRGDFVAEEVELVLKLGLMCSQVEPGARPTMRQVVQYLEGELSIQDFKISSSELKSSDKEGFDEFDMSYPSSLSHTFSTSIIENSILSGGR